MTVGDYMGQTRSLYARVWRVDTRLRVLAEYDVEAVEQHCAKLLDLNRDYAQRQFSLAQTNLKLGQAANVFAHCGEGIIITDANNIIIDVNPAFTRITGYSRQEVIGQTPRLLSSSRHDLQFYTRMWKSIEGHDSWQGEIWNRRKNGEIYAETLAISVVRDAAGKLQQYIGIFSDVTEKMQTAALLVHSQKMEAIGTLAGGIAHDFNNILTSILGFNHLILGDIGNPDEVAKHVRQIHMAGNRAKDLVRQILTFSRQMPSDASAIDLCHDRQ